MMVSLKLDAQARVQGSEEQERYPIVAKVKGTGKDGGLSIQVSGDGPISARISGDSESPIAIAPLAIEPITVTPDLKSAAQVLNVGAIVDALTRMSQGLKVDLASSESPLSIALARIPVDLTISVSTPAQETVFKVEIKGTIGE